MASTCQLHIPLLRWIQLPSTLHKKWKKPVQNPAKIYILDKTLQYKNIEETSAVKLEKSVS